MLPGGIYWSQPVYLQGTMYLGARRKGINGYAKLYAISSKFTSWSSLTVPTNVDDFTLAVYHSQLVLIGGIVLSASSFEVQSDLWVPGV